MRILAFTTSSNNTPTVLESLKSLGEHEVTVIPYDKKYHQRAKMAIDANPGIREALIARQWPPPGTKEREAWLQSVSPNDDMLAAAKYAEPDLMIYISAWEGDFVPSNETLGQLNSMAPLIHLCFDGADSPWWPQMKVFEERGVFSLTATIDGAQVWPGAKDFREGWQLKEEWRIKKAVSVLTPCDPAAFQGPTIPFMQRPFAIAYAGNAGGWLRGHLVSLLQRHKSHLFTYRPRDNQPDSYRSYTEFLKQSKCVISVPFTGSTLHTHVKGRPIEAGWAGAAVLEWKNDAMRHWFLPRYEYWEYQSVETCLEETEYLAAHPALCEELARALHHRVSTEHTPHKIWGTIFNAL